MIVSVYLSNNIINAVVGSGGRKIRADRVYTTQIPDGSLINGIITNEAELTEHLRNFWQENRIPKNNVELVINSSQLVMKTLTLPRTNEKKLREMLPLEFGDVSDQKEPLFDYMIERKQKKGKTITLQAVMAERSYIMGYLEMFRSFGVKVTSIGVARICRTKLLSSMKQLKEHTCMVLTVDGTSINSMLWVNGESVYSTQRRVFCEPGTPQFGAELARIVSTIQQFAITQQIQDKIEIVYLTGVSREEFEIYGQSVEEMELGITFASLGRERHIGVSRSVEKDFSFYLAELGNLIKEKKDINLVTQAKKKVKKKSAEPTVWKRYVILPAVLLVVSLSILGVLLWQEWRNKKVLQDLNNYLTDPQNIELNQKSEQLLNDITELSRKVTQIQRVKECVATYPYMNSKVEEQLQESARGKSVTLDVRSYEAATGILTVDAKAKQVEQINYFIDTLSWSGVFDDVQYTGYTYDEKEQMYTINVMCYLSENAGK